MKWINDLKISSKLILLVVTFLISLVAVGYTGYHYLAISNTDMAEMYNDRLLPVKWLNDNRNQARAIQADLFDLMLTTDDSYNQQIMKDIDARTKLFAENLAKYEQTKLDSFEAENLKKMNADLAKFREARKEVIALALQNKNQEAYVVFNQNARPFAEAFNQSLSDLAEYNAKKADEISVQNKINFNKAMQIFVGIILFATVCTICLGWIITRRISKRMNDIVKFLGELSKGNFSKEVPNSSLQDKSEFGTVSKAIDTMNKNIRNLIRQLAQTSEQLAASSEEMTASAEQSAQASNQVAISITEVAEGAENQLKLVYSTSEVVGQMSNAIQQVAQNAVIVSSSTEKTGKAANEGERAVEKAINQMNVIDQKTSATANVIGELEEKSNQIGQIVETISNIAGQTNLLALNAAIEAARAGEQGRGFSVVADEVRKLAEQSQDAAKQIADLIGEVQEKTNHAVAFMNDGRREVTIGTDVVNVAGAGFREIIKMIREISDQIHEISAAIEQLTSGSQHVVSAVQEIDQESQNAAKQTETVSAATEEQSASIEEIASSSQMLSKMAEELQSVIQQFKV